MASDLICHTDNAADCYPKTFEPTKDFQTIHDDQDIPPGLHIRMDIYSGKKEARLNILMEGEEAGIEAADIPTEQAMVVVDQPKQLEEDAQELEEEFLVALRDRQSKKPPAYEAAGKIMPPREPEAVPDGVVPDSVRFSSSVKALTTGDATERANNLPTLLELSHDIYYGVELMKNPDVFQRLLWELDEVNFFDLHATAKVHKQAAGILANSIQNNPTALKEAQRSWRSLLPYPNGRRSGSTNREDAADNEMAERMLLILREETDPAALRVEISALSGIVKAKEVKEALLEQGGMGGLLTIFRKEGKEWDVVREKLSQFIADNFLDEDMGAELGKWPVGKSQSGAQCRAERKGMFGSEEACWPYFVEDFGALNDDEEWVGPFFEMLDKSYERFEEGSAKDEKGQQLPMKPAAQRKSINVKYNLPGQKTEL